MVCLRNLNPKTLKRRDFVQLAGLGIGGLLLPFQSSGRSVSVEELLENPLLADQKKQLADIALNTAKASGATYVDVRIGRYLNQFIITREDKVQNIVNTESYGLGVRVVANGSWGFAATDKMEKADQASIAMPCGIILYLMMKTIAISGTGIYTMYIIFLATTSRDFR